MKNKQTRKPNDFLRSLAHYSALGGALIGSTNQVQATIQYSTLSGIPTSNTIVTQVFPGGQSIRFREEVAIRSFWLSLNGVSVSGAASAYFPDALNAGFLVSAGGAWHPEVTQFMAYSGSVANRGGNFIGTSGKFLAIRFNNGGVKYGWIRLSAAADASTFTLTDWAYQDNGSPILTGDTGTPTPIELLSFDIKILQHAVALQWSTAREENFDGFSLERAEEGSVYTEIAWIPGSGNSSTPRNYAFNDETILENKRYYYRLKSIDLDGSFEYSQIVEAVFNDFGFNIKDPYPNPVSGNKFSLEIQALEAEPIHIRIFSVTGQMVYEQRAQLISGENTIAIAVPNMPAGAYFLKVQGRYYSKYKSLIVK
ncbi:MAG: T9SS type A sorting domain-containing protein [Bacteroidia bacterium]